MNDNTDAPDTHEVTWEFPGVVMTWMMSQVSSFGFNLQDVERYAKHGAPMEKGVRAAAWDTKHPCGEGDDLRQLRDAQGGSPGS